MIYAISKKIEMEEMRNTEIIILLNYAAAKISDMTAHGCH